MDFSLKFHQDIAVNKTIELIENGHSKILWGHVPRSGKSYIMAGTVLGMAKRNSHCANFLLITTAPNETIGQYMSIFTNHTVFKEFIEVHHLKRVKCPFDFEQKQTKHRVFICSKQFLQKKDIEWLKDIDFTMRFVDESHHGGTTGLALEILEKYGRNSPSVYITATYTKPVTLFDIPGEAQIVWDLEDIQLCKNYESPQSKMRFAQKHGFALPDDQVIMSEYQKYPDIHFITLGLSEKTKVFISRDDEAGFSTDALFMTTLTGEFINEPLVAEFCKSVFVDLLDRAKNIAEQQGSRWFSNTTPLTIMCFLPCGDISGLSRNIKNTLEKYQIIPEFDILAINGKNNQGENPKSLITNSLETAKQNGKIGLLVLSGKQCSLGVTIETCDVVVMMNNNSSYDVIYQTIFRSMSEAPGKKCGFVIDVNLQRVFNIIVDYALKINPVKSLTPGKPENTITAQIEYMFEQRLFTLDIAELDGAFTPVDQHQLAQRVYSEWSSHKTRSVKALLKALGTTVGITIPKGDQTALDELFLGVKPKKKKTVTVQEVVGTAPDLPKGKVALEAIEVPVRLPGSLADDDVDEEETPDSEDVQGIDFIKDIMVYVVPFFALLTIRDQSDDFAEMIGYIQSNEDELLVTLAQFALWWKTPITKTHNLLRIVIEMHEKHLRDTPEFKVAVSRIKSIFRESLENQHELSKLVDEYLIPSNLEKLEHAEVSTPYPLRKEMLDKIPPSIWKARVTMNKKTGKRTITLPKIFEPCAGKGGFLVDIVERLMNGLRPIIKDPAKRYKTVVEQCVYWSDINPTNVYICKLLLDPFKQYKLLCNEGDTLEFENANKFEKFLGGISGVDAVIGNPPYNAAGCINTGQVIWNLFVRVALNRWLRPGGVLVFVHPSGWRKPPSENSKYADLFQLMAHDNWMRYLEIHDARDGMKIFGCGTRYDWYVIEHTPDPSKYQKKSTQVMDQTGKLLEINLHNWDWLPNYDFTAIKKLLANGQDEKCPILVSSVNTPTRKWISSTPKKDYPYILVHSTPQTGTRYLYSKSKDKTFIGTPKVIFGETGVNLPIIDLKGRYGISNGAMAIEVRDAKEAENVATALISPAFKQILDACLWSNFRIDWRMFTFFKRDFWKYVDTE